MKGRKRWIPWVLLGLVALGTSLALLISLSRPVSPPAAVEVPEVWRKMRDTPGHKAHLEIAVVSTLDRAED